MADNITYLADHSERVKAWQLVKPLTTALTDAQRHVAVKAFLDGQPSRKDKDA